ncbi:MAG: NADH-quinone oxidoreductase subunit A [Cyclobacteriaceae bacterium]|jgi:NADH-quinone oxidoreductase subunit A
MEISGFGTVLLFFVGGLSFVMVTLLAGKILRPNRPNEEKNTTYESGEEPFKNAWNVFNIRFYIIALAFLLFETELVFLFPWATVFADKELMKTTNGLWGQFALVEVFIFIGLLAVGLFYIWKKGMLDWDKPEQQVSDFQSKIPAEEYKKYQ